MEVVGPRVSSTKLQSSFSANWDAWAPIALATVAIVTPAWWLMRVSGEFPMDDAYVHFVYAENLAHTGKLVFNAGEFGGVGTTSILWVGLLALAERAGLGVHAGARFLGIVSLMVMVVCAHRVVRAWFGAAFPRCAAGAALGAALLVALSGNLIWFSLSGMETMLFLALGFMALVCYQQHRFLPMALCLALMTLTRTEGAGLALALLVVHAFGPARSQARPREWRRMLAAVALFIVMVAPWFIFLQVTTGHALPTSFAGKKLSQMSAIDNFLSRNPRLQPLIHFKPIVFLGMWLFYIVLYVFGGMSFPGPRWACGDLVGIHGLSLSYLGLAVTAGVMLPLAAAGLVSLRRWRMSQWLATPYTAAVVALLAWLVIHNLAYMALFPSMGTGSRYQAINHVLLWVLIGAGVAMQAGHRRRLFVCASLVAVLAGSNAVYWRSVYAANIDHMKNVRIQSSRWIARNLPPEATIAAHDIGAVKYYCERPVVDMGGLVDASFPDYVRSGEVAEYLRERGVTHLVIPGKHSSESEPVYDFLAFLGLKGSSLLELREVASYENDYDIWVRGNAPTANYLPSVKVYAIRWRK